jgi:hypothetical protein
MQRNKTQRKRMPSTPANEVAGPFGGDTIVKATEDSLDAFFAAEVQNNFQQVWQKLDRGSRLDRLRKWVQTYEPASGSNLTLAERASLRTAVLQAFELKQLNTKVAVEYDPVDAIVTNVRGLRERTTPNGLRTYRIEAPRPIQKTRKASSSEPAPAV